MSLRSILPWLGLSLLVSSPVAAAESAADTLAFEIPESDGGFVGWHSYPKETVFVDSTIVHGGRCSARLERGPASPSSQSVLTRATRVTFAGHTVELRGWLRTQDVEEGFVALWLREDAGEQLDVQFDNMHDRGVTGTTDWTEYRIRLPLDRRATRLVYGVLVACQGVAWADDLQILVDGRPLSEAPVKVRVKTAIDTDHEFDDGSRIAVTAVSKQQVEHLVLLAKVWGFLKYHDPRVAAAQFHWDYELFRVLPDVLAAHSRSDAAGAMTKWMDRLGKPGACTACASLPDSLQMRPDLNWIHDRRRLGRPFSKCLETVYRNRSTAAEQHYVWFLPGDDNPDFSNELLYGDKAYPDPGYRLLALFRFWNIIEYWFPYRDLLDEKWEEVLAEYVPRVLAATNEEEYARTMMTMVHRVGDGHAGIRRRPDLRPPTGECRVPIALRYVEDRFVVHAYTDSLLGNASGTCIGDAIVKIDGHAVDSLVDAVSAFYSASNETFRRHVISFSLTRGPCGPCVLTVERDGQVEKVVSSREALGDKNPWASGMHDLPGPAFQRLSDEVAYLKLSAFAQWDVPRYLEQAEGTRCLIIDVRNYPSDFAPFALGAHLVSKPTPFACFTKCDTANPGAFVWTAPEIIEPASPHYDGKIAVLVDEASMSQSEYTAMAFRAVPGATVVGSTTAGADGNVSRIPLPGGIYAGMSGVGVFYPDRSPTQRIGIVPDLLVRPTIAGIKEGRDEVLEAAIRHLVGHDVPIRTR